MKLTTNPEKSVYSLQKEANRQWTTKMDYSIMKTGGLREGFMGQKMVVVPAIVFGLLPVVPGVRKPKGLAN